MSTTPTARTLELLRKSGWQAWVVEQNVNIPARRDNKTGQMKPPMMFKRDVWGFGDILAANPEYGILIVQTTSGPNLDSRFDKIRQSPEALPWLRAGGLIHVHGWAQRGAAGKAKRWTCRIVALCESAGCIVVEQDHIHGKQEAP